MKILENTSQCVGCGLCEYVCPKNCITMTSKNDGFLYPSINEELCILCKKCQQACPVLSEKKKIEPLRCVALEDIKDENRKKSASGGAASLLFEEIINMGGAVCGCRLDDDLKAVHDVSDTLESIDLYRDSKYVQSDMKNAWKKIEDCLLEDRKLIVCGTPCQIAAVNSRFGQHENLYTCDFVCSGVPDPSIFELYKRELEQKSGKKIKEFYFRDKTNGWKKSNIRIVYTDDTEEIIERKDSNYYRLFGNNIFFRESCYDCKFKNFNTYADLTVGDYWGIERLYPECDDIGCSLVIVNTKKGDFLLSAVKDKCRLKDTHIDFAIETHPKIISSINRAKYRDLFYNIYNDKSYKKYKKAVKLSMSHSTFCRIKRVLFNITHRS